MAPVLRATPPETPHTSTHFALLPILGTENTRPGPRFRIGRVVGMERRRRAERGVMKRGRKGVNRGDRTRIVVMGLIALVGLAGSAEALPPETYYTANVARRGYVDDDHYGPFPIGFSFDFFGAPFSEFYAASNGYLGFGPDATYDVFTNQCLPQSNVPNTVLAFWDDIVVHGTGGVIFYQTIGTAPNRKCVAQFTNMGFWNDPTLLGTFSIILYEGSDEIQVQYRILVDPRSARAKGNSATIGLNGGDGSAAVQHSCNTADAIASEQAIRFAPSGGSYTVDDGAVYEGILLGDALPPTIPVLVTPAEGSTICLQPTFQWAPSENAESYLFRIATNSTLSGATDTNVGTATSYTPPSPLSDGTTYYWAVFANGNGNTTWSQIYSFTASSGAPPVASPKTVWTTLGADKVVELEGVSCGEPMTATVSSLPVNGALYQCVDGSRGDPISSVPAAVTDSSRRVIYHVDDGQVGMNRGLFDFFVTAGAANSSDATVTVNVYAGPTVTTAAVTDLGATSATCGGNVVADNGYAVTSRGVCWAATPQPTVGADTTRDGSGTGAFTSSITGLTTGTLYYVRAYAVNSEGVAYGSQASFTPLPDPPTVTTAVVSSITDSSGEGGGDVTDDGGAAVTARGLCWSTSPDPTVADSTTSGGTGTGGFTATISGLDATTTYHVRAYATNSGGTAYGENVWFSTTGGLSAPLPVTGFNHDLVAEGTGAHRAEAATTRSLDSCKVLYSVSFDGSYGTGPDGIPDDGVIVSERIPSIAYQLDPYDGPNALRLAGSGEQGTLTLTSPGSLRGIAVLATSSEGNSAVTARVQFDDASYADFPITVQDWFGGANPAIRDMGRVSRALAAAPCDDDYDEFDAVYRDLRMYDHILTLSESDRSKSVSSVRFTKTSAPGRAVVMAAGGIRAPGVQASSITFSGVGAAQATLHWTRGDGTACAVFMKEADSGAPAPADTTSYTANASFGSGSEIASSGWHSVYGGTADSVTVTGLGPGTTYRAMVCELYGGAGEERYLTAAATDNPANVTTPTVPAVTTAAPSNIDMTSADGGGEVTSDGGAAVTARGVCWSTSANPTVADDTTHNGSGTGAFTSDLGGLTPNTRYYVRAYAMNAVGTSYGSESDFRTGGALLSVTSAKGAAAKGPLFTTIQEALDDAETTTGDTIQVEDSVHTEAGIGVAKNVVVRGLGADSTVVQAAASEGIATDRVFIIGSATVLLRDMTIRYGRVTGAGGGIHNSGDLTVERCVIRNNRTLGGGNNEGAGLRSMGGKIALYDCTIRENVSEAGGGGMTLVDSAVVRRCAITGNEAAWGGGVVLSSEHQQLVNCTISGNRAASAGGGVTMYYNTASMTNCTVTGNSVAGGDGGGIYRSAGTLRLASSIVAGNSGPSGDDVSGTVVSEGYNLIGDNTGSTSSFPAGTPNGNDDWVGSAASPIDALLDSLADNGGWAETNALRGGSPAIDQIANGVNGMGTPPLDEDQRGEPRPARDGGDIGAYEAQVTFATVVTGAVTDVRATSFTGGGTVIDDGGATVTARGVCYAVTDSPTVAGAFTADGTGEGAFTSTAHGLDPVTTYYARAYATNAVGTSYGDQVSLTTAVDRPSVTTANVTSITSRTATGGGEVTSSGGADVTARGVCVATHTVPSLNDEVVEEGEGVGAFTAALAGLDPNTRYYVRAYGTNGAGTRYGNLVSFETSPEPPTVTTAAASSVTDSGATAGGEVTDEGGLLVTARGLCWGTGTGPTLAGPHSTEGTGLGTFTSAMGGLEPNETYYARAYAVNGAGTAYGDEITFVTGTGLPVVVTGGVDGIGSTFASAGGEVTGDGGGTVTERGVCWNEAGSPTTAGPRTSDGGGTGSFTSALTGLLPDRVYHLRAYAVNGSGTAYGQAVLFTTLPGPPAVVTADVAAVGPGSAECGGTVTDDGGSAVTARGVCWSSSGEPTVDDDRTSDGAGTGSFASLLSGLEPNTPYLVRAYGTNGAGTGYGGSVLFMTTIDVPTVILAELVAVAARSAEVRGEVVADGGSPVTARGFCWNRTGDPTVEDDHHEVEAKSVSFTAVIEGLDPGALYYVRAYAVNAAGTSYGETFTLTTGTAPPAVTTAGLSEIGATGGTGGGDVTDDGGAPVTVRGLCWSDDGTPTLDDFFTEETGGTGPFGSVLTGLAPNTPYLVRAYATNEAGTSYGDALPFTTVIAAPGVTTASVASVTARTATIEGNVTAQGGAEVTERGVVCGALLDPAKSIRNEPVGRGTGPFTVTLTGLLPNRSYSVRAYAANAVGTTFGDALTFTTAVALPALAPAAVSNVTSVAAGLTGVVTDAGGGSVMERGFCYGTEPEPTVGDDRITTVVAAPFTGLLAGLRPNTTYYVRAYAVNEAGTGYGTAVGFKTSAAAPTVATTGVSEVTAGTATVAAEVTDDGGAEVSGRGVIYGSLLDPGKADRYEPMGSGVGPFSVDLRGLAPNTTYRVRAYAINAAGTSFGDTLSFKTLVGLPAVSTSPVTWVTANGAECGGEVSSDGGSAIVGRGVCWSLSENPTIEDERTVEAAILGAFTCAVTGLEANTTYHVRAYGTNEAGTAYGADLSFTTSPSPPSVATFEASSVGESTVVVGGEVIADGGAEVTGRGICYGTAADPTVQESVASGGSGTGAFTCDVAGLDPDRAYHFRAFATNAAGTAYGGNVTVRTAKGATVAFLSAAAVTVVGGSTAECAWSVLDDGGAEVTARGVCYGTLPAPTVENEHTDDGTGTGTFTTTLTGLQTNTTYYVRAYATNRVGTAYGTEATFGFWRTGLALAGAHPAVGLARMQFTLGASGPVRIDVYDILGRRVRTVYDTFQGSGVHQAEWDGRTDSGEKAASGIYYLRLTTEKHADTKKIVFLR